MTEWDMAGRIDHDSDDETGQLSDAFNSMVTNLKNVIGKVMETSSQVAASATQLRSEAQRVATDSEVVVGQAGTMPQISRRAPPIRSVTISFKSTTQFTTRLAERRRRLLPRSGLPGWLKRCKWW